MAKKDPKPKGSASGSKKAKTASVAGGKQKITQAEETLSRLIKEAGADAVRARLQASSRSTRNAMDELFDDSVPRDPVSGIALVGLEGSDAVASHDAEGDEQSGQAPRLAGAQDADSQAPQPEAEIRQLDDGVDFWDDLDRTGNIVDEESDDDE